MSGTQRGVLGNEGSEMIAVGDNLFFTGQRQVPGQAFPMFGVLKCSNGETGNKVSLDGTNPHRRARQVVAFDKLVFFMAEDLTDGEVKL
jgi:hypothetical protein